MLCVPMFIQVGGEISYQGIFPETLGGGVQPASKNSYPIEDQNLQIFPSLFMN